MRPGHLFVWILVFGATLYLVWRYGGHGHAPWLPAAAAPPSVVLISVDTLRADALGCYGSREGASPNIDAFAQDAVVFTQAYTPEPQTLPAHASLLTGLYPATHGVLPTPANRRPLSRRVSTIADLLGDAGYRTGAFVNVGWLSPVFGLDVGFDRYDFFANNRANPSNPATRFGRDAGQTNRAALEWLDLDSSEPTFLFLHYFDVHSDIDRLPYDAPADYRSRFVAHDTDLNSLLAQFTSEEASASSFLVRVNQGEVELSPPQAVLLRSLYLSGVAYADAQIGALFDELRRRDLYDSALIVLVADHGEEFLEHGKTMHTQIYDECLHVPFILKLPDNELAGRRVHGLCSIIDVLPSIAAKLGIEPPAGLDGIDLGPLIDSGAPDHDEILLSYDLGSLVGLRTAEIKLITLKNIEAAALFDLRTDPEEKANVAGKRSRQAGQLRGRLFERIGALERHWSDERVRMSEAQERAFEALGYTHGKKPGGK